MKLPKVTNAVIMILLLLSSYSFAQTARIQIIHNSADVAADSVDIYLNGSLLLDNFKFRTATSFIDAPAGVLLNIGVAPANTSSVNDTLKNFPVTLSAGGTYVAIADGVLNPADYAANPDGKSTAFTLFVKDMARESAFNASKVDFFVLHGATDAPTVDILARGVGKLIDDAAYGDITPYLEVDPSAYSLDITPGNDNNTVVTSVLADLNGLSGASAVVFASGFLDPANNQNGKAFGVFAALPNGTVVQFQPNARLQVIHNSADTNADPVDIYLNGSLLLDDFGFRKATPFINAPAGVELNIGIAPSNSSSINDTLKNFQVTLNAGKTYVAFANGVLDPGMYKANPDGRSTAFTLFVNDVARESSMDSTKVDFFVLHGSSDAPTVDILARGISKLVDDAAYGDITPYIEVNPATYSLDITPGDDNNTVVTSVLADLNGLSGSSAVVFASGFLDPANNQEGNAFGVFAALPNGTVVQFRSNARLQVIHNSADVNADPVDIYLNGSLLLDDFGFRKATPFINAPAGVELNIGVAPSNSSSITDTLKNFQVTLNAGGTYIAFANGVLDPGTYSANPDGNNTSFTLFVNDMARESAFDSTKVEFFVLHGATDAPTVDVIARGIATLVDDAAYKDLTDYIAVNPSLYTLDITPGNDNSAIVTSLQADLNGLAGETAAVFASGFLNPSGNENGSSFGILAALANGTVVQFSTLTGIETSEVSVPVNFELKQNYPNPFNPSTKIQFSLPVNQTVTLKVFNMLGQEVATLLNKDMTAGYHNINFNANGFSSGIYLYQLKAGNFIQTKKMTLLK